MLDDFRQDKNDSKETAHVDLFASQDFLMIRKIGLGTLAFVILSICAWFSMSSSSSESNTNIDGIETRLSALEKAVFNAQAIKTNIIATADTGSGPVGSYNNPILSNPNYPPQSDDLVLPMEEDITYDQPSNAETTTPAPKEIALELSSLFETELAMSSTSPQQQPLAPQKSISSSSTAPSTTNSITSSQTKTYTVQKGDTLSKISLKFYGTSKKWKKIVEANREKLGQNQILKTGMVIVIPENN